MLDPFLDVKKIEVDQVRDREGKSVPLSEVNTVSDQFS